jgi:DNA-binding NtrC family response regulator
MGGRDVPSTAAPAHILVADGDPAHRETLAQALQQGGHKCVLAGTGAETLALARRRAFDLLLLDLRLPDADGLRLLPALRARRALPVIALTAQPSVAGALAALSCEVCDYLPKPVQLETLLERISGALCGSGLGHDYVWRSLARQPRFAHVLSENPATRQVYLTAARVARSRAPVLIGGETGTGKEYLARALHGLSDRAEAPFVTLNCGAFPEELLESELFGHEKGAYTSAAGAKPGLCELAAGGVLFLDEIGDMSPAMQVKLLRFLDDGSYRRLGGTQERQADVRLLAATNQDLARARAEGRFREDLYWRLNVIPLRLPPLRERPEDLAPFSRHFLGQFARELQRPGLALLPAAQARLSEYAWPGNLRQLHNVLWRAALLTGSGSISPEQVVWE